MKIALAGVYPFDDVSSWSGTMFYMRQAFFEHGCEVETIDRLTTNPSRLALWKEKWYPWLGRGKQHMTAVDPSVLKSYSRQIDVRLKSSASKVVIMPWASVLGYLKDSRPCITWNDATFAGLVGYYNMFENLTQESLRQGHRMQQRALDKCDLAIFSSEWAANTAINNYNVDPAKVKVVPYGANLNEPPSRARIEHAIRERHPRQWNLIFIGTDWERKGGLFACKVTKVLRNLGWDARLRVVGCNPLLPKQLADCVTVEGYISKSTERGREHFKGLLERSHFLVLPTRAECFGIVFAEASASGVPSLAPQTGGIPTAILDGVNGMTFPVNAPPEVYAEFIAKTLSNRREYEELAFRSFEDYQRRLNWNAASAAVLGLISEHCNVN